MKRYLIALLCAALIFAATGCAGGKNASGSKADSDSVASENAVIDVPVEDTSAKTEGQGYTDEQLVTWAGSYYEFCTGEKCPNVAVDHVEGDTVYICVYEDVQGNEAEGDPGHRTVIEWYIVDRNTAAGRNFEGEAVDLAVFLRRTGDSGDV